MAKPIKNSKRSILKKIRKQILSFVNPKKARVFVYRYGHFINEDSYIKPWAAFVWEAGKNRYSGYVVQCMDWKDVSYAMVELFIDENSSLLKK